MENLVSTVTSAILSLMPLWNTDAERTRAAEYAEIVIEEAQAVEPEIDPFLVVAIIYRESSFRADVRGQRGEVGLMQILPLGTLTRSIAKDDLSDVRTNVRVGLSHLVYWQNECGADRTLVWVSAYNSGKCRANGYGKRVLHLYNRIKPARPGEIS
jgi:soluble lytic murein transglycosylase-like protein